jgi:hypothetical protein
MDHHSQASEFHVEMENEHTYRLYMEYSHSMATLQNSQVIKNKYNMHRFHTYMKNPQAKSTRTSIILTKMQKRKSVHSENML